jgi:hypothetical protein
VFVIERRIGRKKKKKIFFFEATEKEKENRNVI